MASNLICLLQSTTIEVMTAINFIFEINKAVYVYINRVVTSLFCGNRFVKAVRGILSKELLTFKESEAETVYLLRKHSNQTSESALHRIIIPLISILRESLAAICFTARFSFFLRESCGSVVGKATEWTAERSEFEYL
jgi:hypothetical protein